jgi:hypothetical protein
MSVIVSRENKFDYCNHCKKRQEVLIVKDEEENLFVVCSFCGSIIKYGDLNE